MRTLSRPMFNMGGPIKQGIMHGIREPYAGGGRAALVGNPLYPRTGGREHHAFFIPPLWAAATGLARFAPNIYRAAQAGLKAGKFGRTYNLGKIGSKGGAGSKFYPPAIRKPPGKGWTTPPSGAGGEVTGRALMKYTGAPTRTIGQKIKGWFTRDPLYQAGKTGAGYLGAGLQKAGRGVKWAGTTPSGLATTGLPVGWFGGKALYNKLTGAGDKDTNDLIEDNVIRKGDKDYGPHTKGGPTITAAMREAKAKADKEKRINELLDTMGYDKARKNAAYDALIDAGRMVSERGTLDPKNIGRELIDPIIAATSARFDKPQQIREAVGLMKVKADIAKQLEDPQVAELRKYQIEAQKKALAGKDFNEVITDKIIRGEAPTGSTLASILRATEGIDAKVIDTAKKPQGKDALDWVTEIVKNSHKEGTPHPAGTFVVSNRVLIIDEQGNVTPYL